MSNNSDGYKGIQNIDAGSSEFNAMTFLVNQILSGKNVATLVKVMSVTNAGAVSPVGFVDVQPMVNQLDGSRNAVPHGVVHQLPYFRMQGGADAIILDPKVGDIGVAVFADRDISAVKASKAVANPGSMRRSDMADGMYIGGFLNGTPVQYVRFHPDGIDIVSPTKIKLQAPQVEVDASTSFTVNAPQSTFSDRVTINGLLTWTAGMVGSAAAGVAAAISGTINFIGILTSNGKRIDDTHTHGGVASGGSDTDPVN